MSKSSTVKKSAPVKSARAKALSPADAKRAQVAAQAAADEARNEKRRQAKREAAARWYAKHKKAAAPAKAAPVVSAAPAAPIVKAAPAAPAAPAKQLTLGITKAQLVATLEVHLAAARSGAQADSPIVSTLETTLGLAKLLRE